MTHKKPVPLPSRQHLVPSYAFLLPRPTPEAPLRAKLEPSVGDEDVFWTRVASRIAKRVSRETGCLVWKGPVNQRGIPLLGISYGKRQSTTRSVRRLVWQGNGRDMDPEQVVVPACGNMLCISIAHLELRPRSIVWNHLKPGRHPKKERPTAAPSSSARPGS